GLLDETVDGCKTKPGALADVLGGVERIEDLIDYFGRDSGAGIGNLDQHVFADRHALVLQAPALLGADVAGADRQHAAVGHGVAGIDREIDDRLLELSDVGLDLPEIAREQDVE